MKEAYCEVCKVEMLGKFNRKFYGLKEDMIYEMQDRHNDLKPVSCYGNLTIIYDQAVQEMTEVQAKETK